MKRKVYAFVGDRYGNDVLGCAVSDDGYMLAQHVSSNPSWSKHDLGVVESDWKHDIYDKHFGAGQWEIEWVDDELNHPGLIAARACAAARRPAGNGEAPR